MAAPYNPPKKNEDFVIVISLGDPSSPGSFKLNPTIAAGDFKIRINDGTYSNLNTLPVADGAGKSGILLTLSATEMNNDFPFIQAIDQTTPKEWNDWSLCIPTTQ